LPSARRTVEQAETGSSVSGVVVAALLALLSAAALLALPEVRRRLHPAAAAPQPTRPVVPMAAATRPPRGTPTPAERRAATPPWARAATPPRARADVEDASLHEMAANILAAMGVTARAHPQRTPEGHGPDSHAEVEPETLQRHPHPGSRQAPGWLREHATQAALVATVFLSGIVRTQRRGRRQRRRRR
jgi:hypothetical protein